MEETRRNREDLLATGYGSVEKNNFQIQLNNFDTYMATPSVFDRIGPPGHEEEFSYHHVPVMRVFGSIPTGHHILAHIHGVYPYIYVPYDNQNTFDFLLNIEKAVAVSLKRSDGTENGEDKILKYIAHVSICKGVPFYGYHVGYQAFYKVYILNSSYSNRVCDLLREGKVNGKHYEAYEAHIPLSLQFLTDFNLFGCGWIRVENLFLRAPILIDESLKTDELVEYLAGFRTIDIDRIGRSALEVDISAQDILNRKELKERCLHHDFIEKFNPLTEDIYIQSSRDLWKDGEFQRKSRGQESYSSPPKVERTSDTTWVDGEEHKSMFEYIKNLNLGNNKDQDFSNFVKSNKKLESIPTAFELVSELFTGPRFDVEFDLPDTSEGKDSVEEDEVDLADYLYGFNEDVGPEAAIFADFNDDNEDGDAGTGAYDDDDEDADDEDEDKDAYVPLEEASEALMDDLSDLRLTQLFKSRAQTKRTFTQVFKTQVTSSNSQRLYLPKVGDRRYIYRNLPPQELDFEAAGLPKIQYNDPFFMETPPKPFIWAGKKFKLESRLLEHLKPGDISNESLTRSIAASTQNVTSFKSTWWKYIHSPPSFKAVVSYQKKTESLSQIGITQKPKFATQKPLERRPDGFNALTLLIMELFVPTRGELKADPNHDEIGFIVWKYSDGDEVQEGIFALNPTQPIPNKHVRVYDDEESMILDFAEFVRVYDSDIIAGYEVHASSWGYLIDRARAKFEINFVNEISRVNFKGHGKMGDHWGYTHTSAIKVCGRHVLNIWRPLRDLKLSRHNIEFVAFHLLHERYPHFTDMTMTEMYRKQYLDLTKHIERRVEIDAKLIESGDLIIRAAEEARLIGVDFYDVYYRGSQYKVESIMMRIAKAENFILFSASKGQVRKQKPLECIPLVMEPVSAYYKSPLIVLDFQSLYPSIMIAYNYCYSTLLGRLRKYTPGYNQIGTGRVKHPPGLLKLLENDINLSPNGLMFAKASVRKSLLAKMLEDILDTRFMVRSTMKLLDDNSLKRLYDNRQLALKLTANVMYGYTSASFSGRMPCSDIADAIVQTGRETLEKAIELIESDLDWGAKVVYGDTDSLFVYLPGKSREDAFRIGNEIADAVTRSNPDPVTLKFEKVYHPAVLLAKKRYVGYSYEKLEQVPKFDAKGIETVRRDGHFALQYIMEKSLRILFESNNVTNIKNYLLEQFTKILYNDVSIQDFCFAKDVKVGTYKNPPPGAVVSEKKMKLDARAEPQYKERVPYLIIEDKGKILRERAKSPEDFIKNNHKIDGHYYIIKTIIPPLERVFNLMGVDVRSWYNGMPKRVKKSALYSINCYCCGQSSRETLCSECKNDELQTILNLKQRMKENELKLRQTLMYCFNCTNGVGICESLDCPAYYTRVTEARILKEKDNKHRQLSKFIGQ